MAASIRVRGLAKCDDLQVVTSADISGDLQLNSSSGTTGYSVVKTGATTQGWALVPVTGITNGTANQVFVTNGAGNAATWTTDVSLPGNLAMIGVGAIASLPETRIFNALKLGGNFAGSLGTVCVADASSVPHWEYPQYVAQYYDSNIVDMNNGGGGALNLMQNASVNIMNSNISYTSGVNALFTLAQPGTYEVTFQTDATTVGAGAQTRINIMVDGLFSGSYTTTVVPGVQSVVLQKIVRANVANTTVAVRTQQVAAGIINTSANDPNAIATTVFTITRIGPFVP